MNIIQKPINFLKEVRAELGKVAWSTREEIMQSTLVVIVTTAAVAVFIGVIDFGLGKVLSVIFK